MFIADPNIISGWSNERLSEAYLPSIKERNKHSLKNLNASVSSQMARECMIEIEKQTGIELSIKEFRDLLALYPYTRIKVAESGLEVDSECLSSLLFMLSHFLLSTRWPMNGDKIDIDEFAKKLRVAAQKNGFIIKE